MKAALIFAAIVAFFFGAFLTYNIRKAERLAKENRDLKYRNQQLNQQKNQWKRQTTK